MYIQWLWPEIEIYKMVSIVLVVPNSTVRKNSTMKIGFYVKNVWRCEVYCSVKAVLWIQLHRIWIRILNFGLITKRMTKKRHRKKFVKLSLRMVNLFLQSYTCLDPDPQRFWIWFHNIGLMWSPSRFYYFFLSVEHQMG